MVTHDFAYLTLPAWDYRMLARAAAKVRAYDAQDEAHSRGWRLIWSRPTVYSWRVAVTHKASGQELAVEECSAPKWYEADGAGELRRAEMEARVVAQAIDGAGK